MNSVEDYITTRYNTELAFFKQNQLKIGGSTAYTGLGALGVNVDYVVPAITEMEWNFIKSGKGFQNMTEAQQKEVMEKYAGGPTEKFMSEMGQKKGSTPPPGQGGKNAPPPKTFQEKFKASEKSEMTEEEMNMMSGDGPYMTGPGQKGDD